MTPATAPMTTAEPKWWGDSMTIWGAIVTALAAILPALAGIGGITLTPDLIQNAGAHLADAAQAVIALAGTILTVYGRVKARQPIERRVLSLKI